ncbi:MAG: ribulose-phosphate 3-epimerase [Candidatus Omnitrophica bacterium]|nr:ribulose-phosphate 3-epimerase [Candidatus Omnitrophota bacterium]
MKIVPAILTDSKEELKAMFDSASRFCDFAQVDIMDGKFVPSRSITAEDIRAVTPRMPYEAHLMVSEPLGHIADFKKAGAARVIFHFESGGDPGEVINAIKGADMKAGIAINPDTPVGAVKGLLGEVDLVLLMSVNPGFYGSKFVPEVINKIEELKSGAKNYIIAMDGGIKQANIKMLKDRGLEVACVGSAVFKGNAEDNYRRLMEVIA